MPLAQSPLIEDEVVLRHLRERAVECASRRRRQNDVVKAPARRDRLDGPTVCDPEQRCEGIRRHARTLSRRRHRVKALCSDEPSYFTWKLTEYSTGESPIVNSSSYVPVVRSLVARLKM